MKKLNDMTDEELALSYVGGCNKAFDLLLQRNQAKLFAYILFVVRDHNQADDIFQETFVKVITRLQEGRYATTGRFSSWIMRIAHNVIMDRYRVHRADRVVEASDDNDLSNIGEPAELFDTSIESRYVNEQVLRDVKKLMNLLPATQREVVFMRFYQELSFKEIAELTNVSINTALGRMRYAIINLRRMAKEYNIALQLA